MIHAAIHSLIDAGIIAVVGTMETARSTRASWRYCPQNVYRLLGMTSDTDYALILDSPVAAAMIAQSAPLGVRGIATLVALAARAGVTSECTCVVSLSDLAEDIGDARKSVRDAIGRLIDAGLIRSSAPDCYQIPGVKWGCAADCKISENVPTTGGYRGRVGDGLSAGSALAFPLRPCVAGRETPTERQ